MPKSKQRKRQVKGVVTQIEVTDTAGLKGRLRKRLDGMGIDMAELAERTGDSKRNVYNWISGDTTVPAEFVARFIVAVPTNPDWLLNDRGAPDPVDDSDAKRAIKAIEAVLIALKTDPDAIARLADWWAAFENGRPGG